MNEQSKINTFNFMKTLSVMMIALLVSFIISFFEINSETIYILFLCSVFFISSMTYSVAWSMSSSLVSVFLIAFLFVEPVFSFAIANNTFLISTVIYLIASLLISILTSSRNKNILELKQSEELLTKLYNVSSGCTSLSGMEEVQEFGSRHLTELIGRKCSVYIKSTDDFIDTAVSWCFKNSAPCGAGESYLADAQSKYIPIHGHTKNLGVLEIAMSDENLSPMDNKYIDNIFGYMVSVLERDSIRNTQEQVKINVEKDKIKKIFLRSISQDMRKPITAITNSATHLNSNYAKTPTEAAKTMLSDITSDAIWLGGIVDNILNVTKAQDGKLTIILKNDALDDAISEAVSRIAKRLGKHSIKVNKPLESTIIPIDIQQMTQAIVNLFDNVIKHTREDSEIIVNIHKSSNVILEVSDNGGGLPNNLSGNIFEIFETGKPSDEQPTLGLGLNVVKSIVESHHGQVFAENNMRGGLTIRFVLPLKGLKI